MYRAVWLSAMEVYMMVCGAMVRSQVLVRIASAMGTCSRDPGGMM